MAKVLTVVQSVCVSVGALSALVGCGGENEPALIESSSPVVTYPEDELYELNEFPLPVCFRSRFNGADSDATQADRDEVRARVEAAWEGLPRSAVAFTGWDACDDDAGFIKVFVGRMVSGNYPWQGGTRAGIMRVTLGRSDDHHTTLHEFGHALGLRHEQLHPDKPPECTASSPNDGDGLQEDDLVLTEYDAQAVLNYCASKVPSITVQEQLFAEMAYPSTLTNHAVRAPGGYDTAGGLLMRSNFDVQTDWTRRGASPGAYSSVTWEYAASESVLLQGSGSEVDDVTLAPPLTDFYTRFSFVDFRGLSHTSDHRQVKVSDSMHAAITLALVGG
jgi:hypothetical protein